jgi:hypothetical protein
MQILSNIDGSFSSSRAFSIYTVFFDVIAFKTIVAPAIVTDDAIVTACAEACAIVTSYAASTTVGCFIKKTVFSWNAYPKLILKI